MRALVTLYFLITAVQSAKILGIFPFVAPSHYILGNALMKGLAAKGHDVTMISPYVEKDPPKNGTYRDIVLKDCLEAFQRDMGEVNMFEMGELNVFVTMPFVVNLLFGSVECTLENSRVQELLKSDETFDVVILEQFLNDAHKGFAAHFNAPLILFHSIGAHTWINILAGNPTPTSYVPDSLRSYSSNMTLYERTINTLTYVYNELFFNFYAFPKQKKVYDRYFPNGPDFYELLYNQSIFLLNSHPSVREPVPTVPSFIDIGGFHVQPKKHLPQDLQKFLDESKEGVIYFSMGSNLKSAQFPAEKRDAILKTFSKLKLKVLWKWEEDVLPGQPKNVKLGKWLPQQEILAHPNVKLFITHGGLLSTTETIYHGVPVLAIPIAADQKMNAQKIVNQGFGLSLNYKELTEETLTEKLDELLNNPGYAENAKHRSRVFHDRQVKPLDEAVYWVEYVIRHGGAPHLRVAGIDLPWYKYMLVDVVALIAVVGLIVLFISLKVTKVVLSRCFSTKKPKLKRN